MIKRPLYPAPAFHNVSDLKEAAAARSFAETIRGLHSILVGPASKPHEVEQAKQRILQVLEQRRRMPLPSMLIPPHLAPPRKRKSTPQLAIGKNRPVRVPGLSPGFARQTGHTKAHTNFK